MAIEKDGWFIHRMGERIDSFNQNEFNAKIEQAYGQGHRKIALDLQHTKFLSLPSIKMIVDWGERLRAGSGEMLLIAPSEKLKRQIGIFGSMDQLVVARLRDLTVEKRADSDSGATPASGSPELDENPGF